MDLQKRKEALEIITDTTSKKNELFNRAFILFNSTPGKLPQQAQFINKTGYNPTNLQTLFYELKKLYGIKESDIRNFGKEEQAPAMKVVKDDNASLLVRFVKAILEAPEELKNDLLLHFKLISEVETIENGSEELRSYFEKLNVIERFKDLYPDLDAALNPAEVKLENVLVLLESENFGGVEYPEEFAAEIESLKVSNPVAKIDTGSVDEVKMVFVGAPDAVKNEIRFRDEFPFIADPDLPKELKILVTEKFNHYFAFCDAHSELFQRAVLPLLEGKKPEDAEQIQNDEIFKLAKQAVENFEADQSIWAEFVHYRDEKKILGLHPIFKERNLQESVDKMTPVQLAKRQGNLKNYINRETKKLEACKDDKEKVKLEEKIKDFKSELILVELKLENAGK